MRNSYNTTLITTVTGLTKSRHFLEIGGRKTASVARLAA